MIRIVNGSSSPNGTAAAGVSIGDRFGPAFSQKHRGETDSEIVFTADMELREIDAVHVRKSG